MKVICKGHNVCEYKLECEHSKIHEHNMDATFQMCIAINVFAIKKK